MSTYKARGATLAHLSLPRSLSPLHPERAGLPPSFKRKLFLHQDGFILTMVVGALQEEGLINLFLDRRSVSVREIAERISVNRGYLHVALRCLAQAGWLIRTGEPGSDDLAYRVTDTGLAASHFSPSYARLAKFLWRTLPFEKTLFAEPASPRLQSYRQVVDAALAGWRLPEPLSPPVPPSTIEVIGHHLDGGLVIAILIGLWGLGSLDAPHLIEPFTEGADLSLRFLEHLGWYDRERCNWTEEGQIACDNALHYGMVGSYFPMLAELPAMLFGDSAHRTHHVPGEAEVHVDRKLNVLASAAAHRKYFMDADEIFVDLFNREPLSAQPLFVADCGCGDGSWLTHIYDIVTMHTKRGRALSRHPLLMIGTDYNQTAIEITRNTLAAAAVPFLALFGDISDPQRLAEDLAHRGVDIRRGLHIRSFIDHNRCYRQQKPGAGGFALHSSGAYVDESGELIPNDLLENDLVQFLTLWRPYVGDHGLILLEAHCVDPRVASHYPGEIHNIVFDTYHGFSRQYPIDFEVFINATQRAGYRPALYHQKRYPSRKPFVSISINRLLVQSDENPIHAGPRPFRSSNEWQPVGNENLADGQALHELLYEQGDLNKPRRWCAASTGLLVRAALKTLSVLTEQVRNGSRPPSISIVDYGTGTGLAAVELLKACDEMGIIRNIRDCGIKFTIHLLDIPSAWFATGYELLKNSPYVQFHSIRSERSGRFLALTDVLGRRTVDVILASMVFHLIPKSALPGLIKDFSQILKHGGALIWNSPDIGPANHGSVLFHEPNRQLRARMLELLEDPNRCLGLIERVTPSERGEFVDLPARLKRTSAALTPVRRAECAAAANRQILPVATDVSYVEEVLNAAFWGDTFSKSFEMLPGESVDTILVPSNQKYLAEIEDPETRRKLIRLLMLHEIMPALHSGAAGTAFGFSVHWTFGELFLKTTTY